MSKYHGSSQPEQVCYLTLQLTLCAGSGPDHLSDAEEECGDEGLGQHHRASERASGDEEGGGGHHVYRRAGKAHSHTAGPLPHRIM